MKYVRKFIFWCHLLVGVTAAVVILIMSATGVLLTYERQMIAWADTRGLDGAPHEPGARWLEANLLLRNVQEVFPGTPTAITWHSDPVAPVEVAFGREQTVFVNAYTGVVLGEGSHRIRTFFRFVTDLHRWLAASGDNRAVGRAITGAANLGFLFLVLSGFYLWWPRNWSRRAVRHIIFFRRNRSPKARDFNWHNVIGFWSLVPLFAVVLSGVVISYPWASDLVYRIFGEEAPARRGPGGPRPGASQGQTGEAVYFDLTGVDELLHLAENRVPDWQRITLSLPLPEDKPVTFNIDSGTGGQPQKRARLLLDPATGQEVEWVPFEAGSRGQRLRSILRFTHTGEVLGLFGQTVAGIVSLGATVLVWTGLSLSLRRFRSWRKRRTHPVRSAHFRTHRVRERINANLEV